MAKCRKAPFDSQSSRKEWRWSKISTRLPAAPGVGEASPPILAPRSHTLADGAHRTHRAYSLPGACIASHDDDDELTH
jgi:hypothetical protein